MFHQLPHVLVLTISSIDPLLDLFLEESPTSISETPQETYKTTCRGQEHDEVGI